MFWLIQRLVGHSSDICGIVLVQVSVRQIPQKRARSDNLNQLVFDTPGGC